MTLSLIGEHVYRRTSTGRVELLGMRQRTVAGKVALAFQEITDQTVPTPTPTPAPSPTPTPTPVVTGVLGSSGARSGLGWNSGIWSVGRSGSAASYSSIRQREESARGRLFDLEHASQWWDPTMGVLDLMSPDTLNIVGLPPWPDNSGGSWGAVAAGNYDATYRTMGLTVAQKRPNRPTVLRIAWEFNGDWMPWRADGNMVAGWRRMVGALRDGAGAKANLLKFGWCLAGLDTRAGFADPMGQLYPGDSYVDIISNDLYDHYPKTTPGALTQLDVLNRILGFARTHGKPMGLDEWGLHHTGTEGTNEGGDNPAFIHEFYAWVRANSRDIAWECYFEDDDPNNVNSSLFSTMVNNNPLSRAAYVSEMGSAQVRNVTPSTVQAAVVAANPGDTIVLADGTYSAAATRLVKSKSGTPTSPITMRGTRNAVFDGGGTGAGYALAVDLCDWWVFDGFTVRNGQKGVMVDQSTHCTFRNLLITGIGHEGVHLRNYSSSNRVENCEISQCGLAAATFGEGIYFGTAQSNWAASTSRTGGAADPSSNNTAAGCYVHDVTAECVDLKEGTTGQAIGGCTFHSLGTGADSWTDDKSNGATVSGNTGQPSPVGVLDGFQTHLIAGSGLNGTYVGNTGTLSSTSGYLVRVGSGSTGVTVYDNNTLRTSTGQVSNIPLTASSQPPAPVPVASSYTEPFSSSLSLTWTNLAETISVADAASGTTSGNYVSAWHRVENSVGSSDMFTEVRWTAAATDADRSLGVLTRYDAAGNNGYYMEVNDLNNRFIFSKVTAGTITNLSGGFVVPSFGVTPPVTVRLESQGSTHRCYLGGSLVGTYADSTFTSGQRGGLGAYNSNNLLRFDDFRTGALAVTGGGSAGAPAPVTSKSKIDYYVQPHPDDEFEAWGLIENNSVSYPVFVLCTKGDATGFGDGSNYQPSLGEEMPPGGTFPAAKQSAALKAMRVGSWHNFLDRMGQDDTQLGVPTQVATGSKPDGSYPYRVVWGPTSARVEFDGGDGTLTAQRVTDMIQVTRFNVAPNRFPNIPEGDIIAVGYRNALDTTAIIYDHPDHRAVHEAVHNTDFAVPGHQYGRTSHGDPDRAIVRSISTRVYDLAMGVAVDCQRTGIFQKVYGWLASDSPGLPPPTCPGSWPYGETDATSIFSRTAWFWVVF